MRRKTRTQRTSKFVGKTFDNGWVCTGINIAHATLTHKNGGPTYWYAFERRTSDGKFDKWIRVEAHTATKIWQGKTTVEEVSKICEATPFGIHKVNYNFRSSK